MHILFALHLTQRLGLEQQLQQPRIQTTAAAHSTPTGRPASRWPEVAWFRGTKGVYQSVYLSPLSYAL